MTGVEHWFLDVINSIYSFMQWPGVMVLMAVESACIPFPSELIMPLAGWMLIKEPGLTVWFVFVAGLVGAVGNTIGSVVSYYIGMWAGRPFLNKYGKYVLISRHDLDTADHWFTKRGSLAVFIGRLLPLIRTYISLPAGIAKMNIWKFLVYTFTGSFIWSTGLAYGGYLLGEHWDEIRSAMRPFDPIFVVIIVILIGLYIWRHIRHLRADKHKEIE